MQYTVLVADDDREIVEALGIYLEAEGYRVVKAYDGVEALEALRGEEIHLILLDVMMPRMDGLKALQKIREEREIPVIILSAKTEDSDKILGLNIGADDYVAKPFNPLEVVARVKSQLRRYMNYGTLSQKKEERVFRVGGILLDDNKKLVSVDGEPVSVTPIEYNILSLLMRSPGRVFSGEEIYERVWQEDANSSTNTVAVHIRHLREKIEINPKEPRYLKVVWGIGYKLEAPGRGV